MLRRCVVWIQRWDLSGKTFFVDNYGTLLLHLDKLRLLVPARGYFYNSP